jgi:hypothetical protein
MSEPCQSIDEPLQEEPEHLIFTKISNHSIALEHFPSNIDPHAQSLHQYLDMQIECLIVQ